MPHLCEFPRPLTFRRDAHVSRYYYLKNVPTYVHIIYTHCLYIKLLWINCNNFWQEERYLERSNR